MHGCRHRGRHYPGCPDPEACGGCLPRLAAQGLAVCTRCEELTREALRDLPRLWGEVERAAVLKARAPGGGSGGSPLPIDAAGAAWRDRVRGTLAEWLLVLHREFGVTLDRTNADVAWMVHRLAVQAGRVLAHPEHAAQLVADLVGWTDEIDFVDWRTGETLPGRRHEGLMREGRRLVFRAPAGLSIRHTGCSAERPGRIPIDATPGLLLRCSACGEADTLDGWRSAETVAVPDEPLTLHELDEWLRLVHAVPVTYRLLRSWADDGHLQPVATGVLPQGGGRPVRRFDALTSLAVAQQRLAAGRRPPKPRRSA